MGGVWWSLTQDHLIFWCEPFPEEIQCQVVPMTNPYGLINNSELELATAIANDAMLLQASPQAPRTITAGCDNVAAVSWMCHGTITTNGPVTVVLHLWANLSWANCFNPITYMNLASTMSLQIYAPEPSTSLMLNLCPFSIVTILHRNHGSSTTCPAQYSPG